MVHSLRPQGLLPLRGQQLLSWPEDAAIALFDGPPTMGLLRSSDAGLWLPPLSALLESVFAQRQWLLPIAGGAFAVDNLLDWDDEALDVADARAWKMVSSLLNAPVRTVSARAVRVPPARELPPHPGNGAEAAVTLLISNGGGAEGSGLGWHHQSLQAAAGQPPQPLRAGDMVAHPATMRPRVTDNRGEGDVCFILWEYQRIDQRADRRSGSS